MTHQMPPPPPSASANLGNMANIVYILYIVGLFVGLTALVGVVIAYINRDGAPGWVQTHYSFQIRTFWIGLLILVIGSILTLILVGWLVLLGWVLWLIIRVVKGMKYLGEGRAIPNPDTWTIP